ncbi:alcohol dehydrogenase catalytic domain-containing protein [Arthrobacter sp. 31Y]|uniref:alcohol dehydrogenase catalytic domain-containing protein n=1 Tax=Arthrobacter sp. 31Y TaxID=1115632 RepID=UPI00214ADBA4|nr:alcohol dehydrogenase catalytic domain-containing protein [Arthrobacter sp. 31Y]
MCGVCRTDLHLAVGDLPPRHSRIVPGHEAVGIVVESGPGSGRFKAGDSVTANTRADGTELLALAADMPLIPTTTAYAFAAADQALDDLANDRITGAAVLRIS